MVKVVDLHTYRWFRDHVIEHTEIGYTLASLDKGWVVVCFDEWSEDPNLRGCLIYVAEHHASYDLWEDELVFVRRWHAEAYAAQLNEKASPDHVDTWMAVNLGDLTRFERAYLDGKGLLRKGKYRGSDAVLNKRADHWLTYSQKEHA